MNQKRIFVSHNNKDSAFCKALVKSLRDEGADVWIDDDNLGAGHFSEAIAHELEARSIFIVVLSKAAIGSPFVRQECQAALTLLNQEPHRVILPVVAQPIESTDLRGVWLFLAPFKRIEAPGYKPYPQAEAIAHTLEELGYRRLGKRPDDCNVPVGATPEELVAEAKTLYNRRQYDCSAMYCEKATQLKPDYFSAWYNLAYALYELNRNNEALAACDKVNTLYPNNGFGWNLRGYMGLPRFCGR